jgi:hypothetical protein
VNGPPVSPRQREYLLALAGDRVLPELGTCGEERMENVGAMLDNGQLTGGRNGSASSLIARLLAAPRATGPLETASSGDVDTGADVPIGASMVPVGVYRLDGRTYVVRQSRGSTRRYALELVGAPPRLMESGAVAKLELEYRQGLVYQLTMSHRLPAVEVAEVSRRYGRCLMCGARLKAATSVQRMIGPVCWRRVS